MTRQQLLEIGQRLLDIHRELLQAAEDERHPGSTYLTAAEAALVAKCRSGEGLRKWAKRHGVVGVRRGRALYFDRRDIEAARVRQVHGSEDRRRTV